MFNFFTVVVAGVATGERNKEDTVQVVVLCRVRIAAEASAKTLRVLGATAGKGQESAGKKSANAEEEKVSDWSIGGEEGSK